MKTYKELIVWQKAFVLVKEIYLFTNLFPRSELYGLVSQMRRSSVSIPSNIAEGFARRSPKENCQFISIALGSLSELETQVLLAKDLKFADSPRTEEIEGLLLEIRKMLIVLRQRLGE